MLSVHWSTDASLQSARVQRQMFGIDPALCAKHRMRAVDLLGGQYVALEMRVLRPSMGMGIVMDAASNAVVGLEPNGPAIVAGLRENDLITVVNGTAVTAIEDGYIVPRSLVTAAIDSTQTIVHLIVFRRFVPPAPFFGPGEATLRRIRRLAV